MFLTLYFESLAIQNHIISLNPMGHQRMIFDDFYDQQPRQDLLNGPQDIARNRVLTRRRRVLYLLFAAAIASLAAAIWLSAPSMLIAHIVIDGAVAWYLAMLVQLRHRREALQAVTAVRPVSDGVKEMPSTPDIHILASG